MKIFYLIILISLIAFNTNAQNYNNILNYYYNSTPVHGVKIKTNIPFVAETQMPTITIKGFNFLTNEPIGLSIVFYIYSSGESSDFHNPSKYYFLNPAIASFGAYTPPVYLSNENGKVIIFIDDRSYHQRFTISAYANGMGETESDYQGWTATDEAMAGTQTVLLPYKNRLAGKVYLPGNTIWDDNGNVGIGTLTPNERLTVNGTIRAKAIKVEVSNWPDYVFSATHEKPSLRDLETFIRENHHLPEIPSASETAENGIDLGKMNTSLLKKIEELTLYIIEQEKRIRKLEEAK